MHIVFVNQTYRPDIAATAQYLTDAAEALVRAGHTVTVVCARRNYLDSGSQSSAEEVIDGVRVLRAAAPGVGKQSRSGRILRAAICNASLLLKLMSVRGADCFVPLTSPPLVAWLALLVSRARGAALVYWVMDVNPEQVIRAGWIARRSLAARLLEGALRQVLVRSARIIVLDRFMKQLLIEKGAPTDKIEILPLWHDEAGLAVDSSAVAAFRRSHGLEGKFVVMHAGNLSICHPVQTVLDAALRMRDQDDVVFAFMGGGARLDEVNSFRDRHALGNIIHIEYQHPDHLAEALAAGDLHLVIMGEAFIGVVHPSKIYRLLGMGLPFVLIGPEECSIGEMVREEGIGARVEHGSPDELVRLIGEARRQPSASAAAARERIASVGRRFAADAARARLIEAFARPR